jgi:hypothetical protein
MRTKFQVAKVGDLIRSLDFPGISEHYMIGMVTEIKGDILTVRGIAKVANSKSERYEGEFTTPQNGAHFMDNRFPGRIVVI